MTTAKSFEKPLTPEEEIKYLTEFKIEEDRNAKDILIERNMRLVAYIAKKYNNAAEDQDDLISIGTIGLIKAIDTFKIDKGTRLATYASRCIENEILMHIRTNKKNKVQVSLQDPIGTDREGNEINLLDILGTDIDYVIDEVQLKVEVGKLYKQLNDILTPREREIVQLRYGLTPLGYKTQREIAQKLDISRSYVSRIEKKALNKLQKELSKEF
ncbi:RNA polymerase sporulation sigma factor SigK [Metaclostridioides mangenotii]|uniref:RNA polymerase sporulation sigma factor SigK n=1 Tax=Metaclostridioides mangenotii TaxID=1540 RepID=UPI0026EA7B60|nr:RNA polymerase sporulation sigma factor SigK [Clostridioides mangenotii]